MASSDAGRSSPVVADTKGEGEGEKSQVQALSIAESQATGDAPAGGYRLYKRRWIGLAVLVCDDYSAPNVNDC